MTTTKKTTKKETVKKPAAKKSYVIKVIFPNNNYRYIRLAENNTLEDLHKITISEAKFGDRHLHAFYLDDKKQHLDKEILLRKEAPLEESDAGIEIKDLNLEVDSMIQDIYALGEKGKFRFLVREILSRKEAPLEESDAGIEIKDLNLEVGSKFHEIYDFGENWKFRFIVLDIVRENTKAPTVIFSKGNPPNQYPEYDDED